MQFQQPQLDVTGLSPEAQAAVLGKTAPQSRTSPLLRALAQNQGARIPNVANIVNSNDPIAAGVAAAAGSLVNTIGQKRNRSAIEELLQQENQQAQLQELANQRNFQAQQEQRQQALNDAGIPQQFRGAAQLDDKFQRKLFEQSLEDFVSGRDASANQGRVSNLLPGIDPATAEFLANNANGLSQLGGNIGQATGQVFRLNQAQPVLNAADQGQLSPSNRTFLEALGLSQQDKLDAITRQAEVQQAQTNAGFAPQIQGAKLQSIQAQDELRRRKLAEINNRQSEQDGSKAIRDRIQNELVNGKISPEQAVLLDSLAGGDLSKRIENGLFERGALNDVPNILGVQR